MHVYIKYNHSVMGEQLAGGQDSRLIVTEGTSGWCLVTSGLLQGPVLGTVIFFVFLVFNVL